MHGGIARARAVVLYGVVARARSLISNTLLERLGDGVVKGVNVLVAENYGFESLEKVSLQGFGKKNRPTYLTWGSGGW
jgi:hypothetical protein